MLNTEERTMLLTASLIFLMTSLTHIACDDKKLEITLVWTPIWHLSFYDRLMPSHESLDRALSHNPSETSSVTLKNSERVPWNTFSKQTVLLSFECKGGYDESHAMSDINKGYIGLFLEMVQYLKISQCFIQKLTADTFKGLTRLATIEINSRYLLHLTQDAFKPLKSLIWINFKYCSIQSISSDLFCDNPKLTFVSFKNNSIRDIKGDNRNTSCRAGTLNSLSLDGNNIGDLSDVDFSTFKLNGILTLANSSVRTLSKKPFDGLSNVITIDLKNNYIREIPDYAFTSVNTTLRYINFGNNRLQTIDVSKTFSGLQLETLNLYGNYITSLTGKLSEVKYLQFLYLQNNDLKTLTYETFSNLSSVRKVELTNNKIDIIEAGIFDSSDNVREIHLGRNNIRNLPKGIFHKTFRLSHLYLDSNSIESLDEYLFVNCRNLQKIVLQDNRLSNIRRLFFPSHQLQYINIEQNKLSSMPIFTKSENGRECFSISSLREIVVGHNEIKYFNSTCFKYVVKLNLSYNLISDINQFDQLQNIEQLYLRQNRIKILPRTVIERLCSNLDLFDFGKNLIEKIDKGTFTHCKALSTLRLDGNKLKVFEPLYTASFRVLQLSGNPIRCDCENMPLINWLNTSSTVYIDHTTCEDGTTLSTFRLENCSISLYISDIRSLVRNIAIPASVVLFVIGIIAIVVFKFRYEIQVIAFYRWNIRFRYCCMAEHEDNIERKYDAFICFAEEDIAFVKTRLIPLLEPKYNVCIYYRDFLVGEDIAESILETIDSSAVIIILLSENFVNSRWGTFEFRSAHYSAIRKKSKRLVIVILNESFLQTKMDLTLRSILYTKSYLKADDSLFKEKLIHAMPSIPVKSIKQNNFEDTSTCNDDDDYEKGNTIIMNDIYDTIQL